MTTIFDTLHSLIDRSNIHDAHDAELLHDAVTGQEQGFKSAEEYRKAQAAKAPAANPAEEDAVLARADEIRKQREAQKAGLAEQQAAIAAKDAPTRPAAPAVMADTPASPTAEPDAAPPF